MCIKAPCVTSSPTEASNSSIGFFNERNPLLSTPIFLNIPGHDHILCLPMTTELQESMQREPVMTRAWALQERLLSSRNLHFTEHQIYWECMKLTACETFPEGLLTGKDKFGRSLRKLRALKNDDSDVLDPLQNVERIYQIWFRVCEGYSRCFLTKETDKLVAISGIATHFQRRLHNLGSPDVYLAGLWRSRLIKNLLWYVESDMDGRAIQSNSESSRRPSDYRAPSWSWLSLDGLVHPGYDTDRENFQVFIRILNAQVDLASSNPTGQLKGGAITLQGLLRQAGWKYTKRSRGSSIKLVFDGKVEGQFCDGPVETLDGHGIGTCYPDIDTGFEVEMLHCLIVGGRNTANGPIVYGLLLRQTTTANEYLRVGYFWLRGNGPCNALKYKLRRPDQAAAFPWGRLFFGEEEKSGGWCKTSKFSGRSRRRVFAARQSGASHGRPDGYLQRRRNIQRGSIRATQSTDNHHHMKDYKNAQSTSYAHELLVLSVRKEQCHLQPLG